MDIVCYETFYSYCLSPFFHAIYFHFLGHLFKSWIHCQVDKVEGSKKTVCNEYYGNIIKKCCVQKKCMWTTEHHFVVFQVCNFPFTASLDTYIITSMCSAACLRWKMANVKSDIYIIKLFTVTVIAVLWAA